MFNARSVCGVFVLVAMAAAQSAPEKKPREGEFEPFNEVVKDVTANNFTKAITDLDIWSQKFPETDYKDDRTAYYVQSYVGANQPVKAMEAAAPVLARDLNTVFTGPTGPATIVRFLYSVSWAISHDPTPTPEALAAGEKAAHLLMAFDHPIDGVSPADWEKARAGMKEQAAAALLYVAMLPGSQAMTKQPPDCAAADNAYTRAVGAYPDKSVIAYELGRAMNCEAKQTPAKLFAAIYEFQRAAMLDPTLGDPKADPKKLTTYADNAYVKVHGSDEGLEQLKQAVKQSPLPPEGFAIKTATEIAEEKRAEFEKSNPQLALWMKIKGALADTDGEQYFVNNMKDAAVPPLRGVLMEAKPACRPKELMVAVPLPDSQPRVEIRLKLDKPLTGKPELNQEFNWEGVPTAFTKDPSFLLTMDITEAAKIEGLKTTPCAPAPAKK